MAVAAAASREWPGAASPLATDLLRPGRLVVLGVFPTAVYLGGDEYHEVLPLLASDALVLPTGLRLGVPSTEVDWRLLPGDQMVSTGREVRWPGRQVRVVRPWRPARVPAPAEPLPDEVVARLVPPLTAAAVAPHLLDRARTAVERSLAGDPADAVRTLVGLGPGLTPSGDDALSGAILTLRATGHQLPARRLAAAVRDLWHRTTSISASLLDAAGRGYATPAVTDLFRAVAAGDPAAVATSLPAVLAVGHSSGADLVAGAAGAVLALASGTTAHEPRRAASGDTDRKVDQ